MNISILGGGSWGTALAVHLAGNGHSVKIWEFVEAQAQEMQKKRECPLLPGVKLHSKIFVSSDMKEVLTSMDLLLIVVPSDKVESTVEKARDLINGTPIVICSKGFASDLRLLSNVVAQKLKSHKTHAEEVGRGMFSGMVLAGGKGKEKLKKVFESKNLKIDLSDDIIGVQIAAALKNILAVFVGVVHGMKLGDNAIAYVMTKGLAEIRQIGLKWGAQEETFDGLAGLGDVIVTCGSKHSRNRHVGEEVGKGRKLEEVLTEMKMVAEGITTVKEAVKLQKKFGLKLPLISGLYGILFEGKDAKEVLNKL
ncbi:NAD(P)-dependent glycerol-3-phosphate dehydrogenase [Candidatus Woesearchaeota archaeon]|nr:NAD(P)-dependent glycerol-3-phosphate dehydrogenase [Candidatus Woesearchaeota archaeon]